MSSKVKNDGSTSTTIKGMHPTGIPFVQGEHSVEYNSNDVVTVKSGVAAGIEIGPPNPTSATNLHIFLTIEMYLQYENNFNELD